MPRRKYQDGEEAESSPGQEKVSQMMNEITATTISSLKCLVSGHLPDCSCNALIKCCSVQLMHTYVMSRSCYSGIPMCTGTPFPFLDITSPQPVSH